MRAVLAQALQARRGAAAAWVSDDTLKIAKTSAARRQCHHATLVLAGQAAKRYLFTQKCRQADAYTGRRQGWGPGRYMCIKYVCKRQHFCVEIKGIITFHQSFLLPVGEVYFDCNPKIGRISIIDFEDLLESSKEYR